MNRLLWLKAFLIAGAVFAWLYNHLGPAPMKVQQELMRHASIQTTMNIYRAVVAETKPQVNRV